MATLLVVCFNAVIISGVGVTVITMLSRQRRDLKDNRRLQQMIAQLILLSEQDTRKNRHAIKNLAVTLKMQSIADSLEKDGVTEEIKEVLVGRVLTLAEDNELAAS